MWASEHGHFDVVKLLLSNGAQVDLQDEVRHSKFGFCTTFKTTTLGTYMYTVDSLMSISSCMQLHEQWGIFWFVLQPSTKLD